jgi:hypothetical protein
MDSNYWYRGTKSPLPKFPASKEYTGNFISIGAQLLTPRLKIVRYGSALRAKFPTHPNTEFFVALQGIESGDHGIFGRIREEGAAIAALAS